MGVVAAWWQGLSVTIKFSVGFAALLLLMAFVAAVSTITLTTVANETDQTLDNVDVLYYVLEMNSGLQEARLLERDFFLQYPVVGIAEARRAYALPAVERIARVTVLSQNLREYGEQSDSGENVLASVKDLNLYLSAARRNSDVFFEAVNLVSQKAAPDTGLESNLDQVSDSLLASFEGIGNPEWLALYWEMVAHRDEYEITGQRPSFQSAFNIVFELRQAVAASSLLDPQEQFQILAWLDRYEELGEQILDLDVILNSKLRDLDLLAESIDPIGQELIDQANQGVKDSHRHITNISDMVIQVVIISAGMAVVLALFVALILSRTITHKIVHLTGTASALQSGNLAARATITSRDELGNLAQTFNSMAAQLQDTLAKEREAREDAEVARQQEAHQRAEVAKSEKRFRTLFEQSRDAIFVVSRAGEFLAINAAALDLLGFTETELMALNVRDLYVDVDQRAKFQVVIESQGAVTDFESVLRRKDGTHRICLFTSTLLHDDDGRVLGYQGIIRDITERRLAEQSLAQYAERLRILHAIDRAVLEAEEPRASAEAALKRFRQLVPYDRASVGLFDFDRQEVLMLTSLVEGETQIGPNVYVPQIQFDVEVLRRGEVITVGNLSQSAGQKPLDGVLLREGIRSYVTVPLIARAQLIGVLNLGSFTLSAFTADQIEMVQEVANQLAIAIQQARFLEAEQNRRQIAETLVHSGTVLNSTLESDKVLNHILDQLGAVIEYDGASLMRIEEDGFRIIAYRGYMEYENWRDFRVPVEDQYPNWQVLMHKHPYAVADVQVDYPRFLIWEPGNSHPIIHSWLGLPMLLRDQVIGMITLDRLIVQPFLQDEIDLAMAFANQATSAIENARLYDQVQTHAAGLESLLATSRDISVTLDLDKLLSLIAERATTLLVAEECVIFRLEDDRETLRPILVLGNHIESVLQMTLRVGEGLTGYSVQHNQPLLVNNAHLDRRAVAVTQGNQEQHAHAMVAPMVVRDHIVGAMVLNREKLEPFSHADLSLFVGLAQQAAIAIENAHLYDQVQQHAAELEKHVAARTAELQAAMDELKVLTRLKDEFVSNVSHELRTPITSMKLRHHLLDKQPERLDYHLPVIRRETERLSDIIDDLLDLSRMQQGRLEFNSGPVHLAQLAREYVVDRAPVAEEKGLTLEFADVERPLPPIQADRGLLTQALGILITNALNYTPAGGRVTVQVVTKQRGERDCVGLQVADTGMGILPEEQEHLFEPFVRGTAGHESGAPGTGLGLALLQQIVERHQGSVEVQSTGVPGEGTVFTIWLPQTEAETEDEAVTSPSHES